MASTSRTTIKGDVLTFLGALFHPKLKRLQQPITTTAAGTTTTLLDSKLGRGTALANDYDGCIVELASDGSAAGVNDGGFTEPATLTLSPAMTSIGAAVQYLLYPPNLAPEVLDEALNAVLRETYAPSLWFPSLATDADFDAASLTNWPDVATPSPATAFDTTAANLLFGERSIRVRSDAVADGIQSLAIPVTQFETLLVVVYLRVPTGSVTVTLYDDTNGAIISQPGSVTVDQTAWTEVRFVANVPSGCENVRVRFLAATTVSDWYVSPPVIVQSAAERVYTAPSWLTEGEQVRQALIFPAGFGSDNVTFSYVALSRAGQPAEMPTFLRADRSVNPLMLELRGSSFGPYALDVVRPFAEVSANATTTVCDRQYLKWKIIANILRAHDDDRWRGLNRTAMRRAAMLGYGPREQLLTEPRPVYV